MAEDCVQVPKYKLKAMLEDSQEAHRELKSALDDLGLLDVDDEINRHLSETIERRVEKGYRAVTPTLRELEELCR